MGNKSSNSNNVKPFQSNSSKSSHHDTAEQQSKGSGDQEVSRYTNARSDGQTTLPGTTGESAAIERPCTAPSVMPEEPISTRPPNHTPNQPASKAEDSSDANMTRNVSSAKNTSDRDTAELPNKYKDNSAVNPFINDGSDGQTRRSGLSGTTGERAGTDRPCTASSVRLEESTSPRSPSHKSNQLVTIAEESSVANRSSKGRRPNRGQMQCKCHQYQMAIKEKDKEISELKTRLSSIMSHKLTDNNPDIADLSDQNRPTLLADRFSELYSNEWTDAFEYLQEKNNEKDKKKIKKLVKLLTHIYNTCRRKVETDTQGVLEAVTKMVGEPEMTTAFKIAFKNLKDVRKQNYKTCMPDFEKNTYELPGKIMSNVDRNESRMMAYVRLCTELCWLMCIQDPPVYMETQFEKGEQFDKGIYSEYTKTGKANGYLVWPALYLYKGGQLLRKGVAQPKIVRTGGRVDVDENRSPPV